MGKRRYKPTVRQILVRDHNWRMGNLCRIKHSLGALDDDIRNDIQVLLDAQADRWQYRHEGRLMSVQAGDPANLWTIDPILADAIYQAGRHNNAGKS